MLNCSAAQLLSCRCFTKGFTSRRRAQNGNSELRFVIFTWGLSSRRRAQTGNSELRFVIFMGVAVFEEAGAKRQFWAQICHIHGSGLVDFQGHFSSFWHGNGRWQKSSQWQWIKMISVGISFQKLSSEPIDASWWDLQNGVVVSRFAWL